MQKCSEETWAKNDAEVQSLKNELNKKLNESG